MNTQYFEEFFEWYNQIFTDDHYDDKYHYLTIMMGGQPVRMKQDLKTREWLADGDDVINVFGADREEVEEFWSSDAGLDTILSFKQGESDFKGIYNGKDFIIK